MCENLYDVRYIPETKTIKEMQVSKILNMKNCTGKPRVFSNVPGVRCLNNSCNIDEVVPTLFSLSVYVCLSFCLSVCLSVSLSCLSACLLVCLSVCAPVCLPACLSGWIRLGIVVCFSACHSLCLSYTSK